MWKSIPQALVSFEKINLFKKDVQKCAIGKLWIFGYIFNF